VVLERGASLGAFKEPAPAELLRVCELEDEPVLVLPAAF
jgi:hypothetical protein